MRGDVRLVARRRRRIDRQIVRIGPIRIKDFAGPKQGDHFRSADIRDRVRVPRRYVYNVIVFATDAALQDLRPFDVPEADQPLARDNKEFLSLHVVIMIPAHNAWFRSRDEYLPKWF